MTLVVTGVGAITALGATAEETWRRVIAGERGFRKLTLFEDQGYRTALVGEVDGLPREDGPDFSRTSELALRAAREAIAQAFARERVGRIGLVVGGTTAGMFETESLLAVLMSPEGTVDPEARKRALVGMLGHPLSAPADRVARELGPFDRVRSLSSACSSGANAILVGATWLELGLVDAVVCGAADALCRVTLAGFNALAALDPDGARPFDRRRRGLTLGEGAGFVVLERADAAAARGKRAICTLLGWAARSEAHHITNPEPSGLAPMRAMAAAMRRAGVGNDDVDFVDAHGTGTPLNDPMESRALVAVLGEHAKRVPVSSQKGQLGHTLAAAGAIEAVITALAIARGVVPPTGGLEEPDPECPLVHVRRALERPVRVALSSSFGFGGMDTVLVLGAPDRQAPDAPRPRGVVITGYGAVDGRAMPRAGELVAALAWEADGDLADATGPEGDAIAMIDRDPDAERARRLDRTSKLAVVASKLALDRVGRDRDVDETGIVVGSAFGAVDATAAFMRRLREKGPRLVRPVDFPGLVPSSPAGYASIYLGLAGPSFVVADLAASGECAVAQAWELVAAGEADRMIAAAVEERSAIVEEIFSVLFGTHGGESRREGAAAIALAAEGAPGAIARIAAITTWHDDARARLPARGNIEVTSGNINVATAPHARRGEPVVVTAARGGAVDAVLARSEWASVRRAAVADACGTHEAAGGVAIAAAAAMVARGEASEALALGSARGSGYAVLLRPCARS